LTVEEEILFLKTENASQKQEIVLLKELITSLLGKQNKNSSNSSKPPSSDSFSKKTKSMRKTSGKKVGGQPGHQGNTLEATDSPDYIVNHDVDSCRCCGKNISFLVSHNYESRQVFDIAPIQLQVTEHRAIIKTCPHCNEVSKACFPKAVSQPVQYGSHVQKTAIYLMNYQLLPLQRTSELFKDLFGQSISTSTLSSMNLNCYNNLASFEQIVSGELIKQSVVHFDETGYYINNTRQWLHSASTKTLTLYMPHEKRGKIAMDAIAILPTFKGIAIHDYWKPYLSYECQHNLCNAHHLRDLTFCAEQEKSEWATKEIALLLQIKKQCDQAKQAGQTQLRLQQITTNEKNYKQLITEGHKAHPPPLPNKKGIRGKVKQSKTQNMLQRFDQNQQSILGFMYDFTIPFDNNLAEQDIRMMKVKQKISGCFRTIAGAKVFARIRSYISTTRKQEIGVLNAIHCAVLNRAYMPV